MTFEFRAQTFKHEIQTMNFWILFNNPNAIFFFFARPLFLSASPNKLITHFDILGFQYFPQMCAMQFLLPENLHYNYQLYI